MEIIDRNKFNKTKRIRERYARTGATTIDRSDDL